MIKISSVSDLRDRLGQTIDSLDRDRAILVVRHSKPAAYLIAPELFEELVEYIEDLEDIRDMESALLDYRRGEAVDAEEVIIGLLP